MADITIINSGFDLENQGSVPIGPLRITASLEAGGFEVEFKDYQITRIKDKASPQSFCDFIDTGSPILGINIMCGNLPTVLLGIELLKQRRPETTIILGGPSATDSTDYLLSRFPIDYIVRGEGELTALELLQALESGTSTNEIAGLSVRENGSVRHNPPRPRVQDLDTLPLPAYDRINFDDYDGRAQIATSRGCPYRCAFCSAHSVWERRVTSRSPENVAEEIASIQDRVRRIDFCDDTFVLDTKRVRHLITAMQRAGIDRPWCCHGRVDLMSTELLREMGEAGCDLILYGIESGSNRVLRRLRKRFSIEDAAAVLKQSVAYVPTAQATFIWGFPFETVDDFYDTVAVMAECSRSEHTRIQAYMLSPLVASPLYEEFKETIKFSPDLQLSISVLPGRSLNEYPELIEFIQQHPELCSSFYYYDHPALADKIKVMRQLGAGFFGMDQS